MLLFHLPLLVCAQSSATSPGSWEIVTAEGEPIPRHEAGFVEYGGKFHLLGGRRIQPVSIYDPATGAWSEGAPPPIEVHHFQPVVHGDRIYLMGAMTGPFPRETGIERIVMYLPETDEWEFGSPIPAHRIRGSAGAALVDGRIYLVGGIINGHIDGHVAWFDCYDPQTGEWTELPDAPRARDHFQCAYHKGKLYAAGGRLTSQATGQLFGMVVPEVDVYDFATGTWSSLRKPLPTPRAGNSTGTVDHHIVVAGGESMAHQHAHAEVEAWDTIGESWFSYPSLQRGRHGTSLIIHEGHLYTCSGSGDRGGRPELTSMERLPLPAFHEERDGFVEIEAEHFAMQTHDTVRQWRIQRGMEMPADLVDPDPDHSASASGGACIEILPDTRVTHGDPLVRGENFSNVPGQVGVLSYPVNFHNPGRYWVWVSAYSTGTEDNGVHVGLNGSWPESGRRLQWCDGKHDWTWSSAQRVEYNHCGYPGTIYLDIPSPGVHVIQLSMREDGTEIDRLILVNDRQFRPEGYNIPDPDEPFAARAQANGAWRFGFERFQLAHRIPYYRDYPRSAFAINAANQAYRGGFAEAEAEFGGTAGEFLLRLTTLAELDGECSYRVFVNGQLLAEFQNPETDTDYRPQVFVTPPVRLQLGDRVAVQSQAHTNKKIPEGDGTAWARGRWQGLVAIPAR